MKKIIILIIISLSTLVLIAQDSTADITESSETSTYTTIQENTTSISGYTSFTENKIGREVIVIINNIDLTITGELISVNDDGIIIRSIFKEIYIPRRSIALMSVNNSSMTK